MKKHLTISLTAVSTLLLLSACASGEEGNSNDGGSSDNGNGSDTVLVYSNSLAGGRQEWIDEVATEAGFDLQFVEGGGGEVLNRLLAESSSPQADVAFGLDEAMFFEMWDEDMLVQYEPEWVSNIPEDANIGDQYFHPLVEQRIFMIYNPEFISESDVPSNWQDLSDMEELQGIYRVPAGMDSGTDQKTILSIILQYVDEDGELGIAQEGWDEVEAFLANGYQTPENEDQLQNIAEGRIPVSYHFLGGIPNAEQEFDFTAVPINPEQGVITMREQIGVINKGEDHDYSEAEAFVDWFGSAEVQSGFVEEFGGLPVHDEAVDSASDRLLEIADMTEPMDVDWNFVRENLNQWIEKVELELMP